MKRTHIAVALCLMLAVAITGGILCSHLSNNTTPVHLSFSGAEVTSNGTVIENMDFVIDGTIHHSREAHDTISLTIDGLYDFTICSEYETYIYDEISDDYHWAAWISYMDYLNRYASVQLFLSADLDYCCIIVNKDRFFVGSNDSAYDSTDILRAFDLLAEQGSHPATTGQSNQSTTQPNLDNTTESTVDQLQADIESFRELLSPEGDYWHWRALGCVFDDPTQVPLDLMFYIGVETSLRQDSAEFADAEVSFLKDRLADSDWGAENWTNAIKLPTTQVEEVLHTYLGIALSDAIVPENWIYYSETDAYYVVHTDAYSIAPVEVTDVVWNEDGTVQVFWTTGWILLPNMESCYDPQMVLTLKEQDDGQFRILSNQVLG